MPTPENILVDPNDADRRELESPGYQSLLRALGWGVVATPDGSPGGPRPPLRSASIRWLPDLDGKQQTTTCAHGAAGAARTMDGIRRLVRALRSASAESERSLGLSAAQLFALRQIAAEPNQSLSDLAKRTLTTQSSVSEVVTRLVDQGFVARTRSKHDRRRAELVLTEAGTKVLGAVPGTIQEQLVAGFNRLTPAQQAGLATGLEAWLGASGLSGIPATMFFEPVVGEGNGEG